MKSVVIYDSAYGNTVKVAKAIAEELACPAILVSNWSDESMANVDLLVVGSPTQGGRPLESITSFFEAINSNLLLKTDIAVFDTRFDAQVQKLPLRMLMRTIGYAADKVAHQVEAMTKRKVVGMEGFIVKDKEGPLLDGELKRARKWANKIRSNTKYYQSSVTEKLPLVAGSRWS